MTETSALALMITLPSVSEKYPHTYNLRHRGLVDFPPPQGSGFLQPDLIMKQRPSVTAYLSAIVKSLIIGLQFAFIKILLPAFDNRFFLFLAMRFFLAFLFILPFIRKRQIQKIFSKEGTALAFYQPVCQFGFQTVSLGYSTLTTVGCISAFGPAINALFAKKYCNEHLPGKNILYIVLILFASFLTIDFSEGFSFTGAFLLLAALCFRSRYNVEAQRVSSLFSGLDKTFCQIFWGMVFFSLCAAVFREYGELDTVFSDFTAREYSALFFVSALSISILFFLNNYTLECLPVTVVGILAPLSIAVTIASGIVFFDESLTLRACIGVVLLSIGVYLYLKAGKHTPSRHQ